MAARKKVKTIVEDETDTQAIVDFAQIFLERLHEDAGETHEPFEKYSDLIKMQFYGRVRDLDRKLVDGYRALQSEL